MLSKLLKQVMRECGLKQTDLADLLGVSLSRVKAMTSGRVKNLTREEGEALIKKLHIRGDWLATGEGPMLQSESERELHRRLALVQGAAGTAALEGLSEADRARVMEILFYAEMGDAAALQHALSPLAPDEAALLDNYRNSPPDARAAIKAASDAFARPAKGRGKAA